MVSLWRRVVRFLGAAGLVLLVLTANDGRAQTTTGTAATGNTLFNATFNCLSMGCHSASTANRFNAINAGGHISYANSQGMGGTAGTAQQYADIGAYLATLFTGLAAQSVTFGVAKNIAIPNIALATSYGDYVALRTVSGFAPTSGSVSYSGTTATYTPNANDCGSDTFRYEAYRSVANGSGTSNARTVSLTITNPSLPVINSASIKNSTVGVATSYTITTTGGTPGSYGASSFPTGLSRSSNVISGPPTTAGTFNATVFAYNCLNGNLTGQSDSQAVTWTVAKGTQAALTARINASSIAPIFTFSSPNGTATLSTTGGSGGGAVSYASSNTAVCTVTLTTQLNLVGAGTCTITATKASDANYNQIQDTIGVTVNPANQTITFSPQTTASRPYVFNGTFAVSPVATASSGLAVTYDSNNTAACTLPGTTSTTVTMVAAGTCIIGANQAGSSNYNAATEVPQSVTITPILPQPPTIGVGTGANGQAVINFTPPANTGGAAIIDYTATCTASGQTTRTATVANSPATVLSMTNGVTYACSVTARNSVGASAASGTVMVLPTSSPVITSLNNATFTITSANNFTVTTTGAPTPTLSMTGTLPSGVTFTAMTGLLSGTPAAGTAGAYPLTFTATNGAGSSMQSFTLTVQKASQTITFAALANRAMRPVSFPLSASASSGLAVTVTIAAATAGNCLLSGNNLFMSNVGTCTVLADQAGNTSFNAATPVSRSFTISQGTQSIVFTTQSAQTYAPGGTFSLNPVGVSVDPTDLVTPTGLTVSRTSLTNGVCTIVGTTVTIIAAGTCTIQVSQAGNANYAAALPVSQDIVINPAAQLITWGAQSNQSFGSGGTFAISPLASGGASGNAITYASATAGVCTVSGTTVTKVSAGLCTIMADQAGDGNYNAAAQVTRSLTITASVPGAPVATLLTATDSQIVIDFDPPANSGGSAITGYRATCNPGGIFANAAASPIKVTGLTNNTQYTCSVVAQNAAGNSVASNTLMDTPSLRSGSSMWASVCSTCHGATPAGVRFNAAGTTGNVINYVRSVQPVMLLQSDVQALTLNELGEIAKYIATFVPAISLPTPFNTPVNVDVSSHLTLGTVSFTVAAVVTQPANGTLSAFTGTQITYTPNAGFVGVDTFTYRGTGNAPIVNGDARTVTITVAPPPAPVITSAAIASGTFNTPFAYQITATNSPFSFGAAPLGANFTLNPMTGAISGTPMVTGTFMVTVSATNAGGTGMQNVDVTISKASQTITFAGQAGQTFAPGGTFALNPVATASSALPVSYTSLTVSVCTIASTTVTMLTAGSCSIAADQAGNANYEAALQVVRAIVISATAPGAPTIGTATPGDTVAAIGFTPPANNGGSAITSYTASCAPGPVTGNGGASPVTVTGLTNAVTYSCMVRASNAIGPGPFSSGTVMVTPTSTPVAPQITSASATTFTVSTAGTFTVTATGTPAPTLSLTGTLPGGVSFNTMSGALSGTPAPGSVNTYPLTVTASNMSGAPMQSFTLTVQKADQSIAFTGPASQPFTTTPISLTATATSGLTVAFTSNTTSVCTISGVSVTLLTVGTCSITANQNGNANFNAATSVTQGFTVSQAAQTITFSIQSPLIQSFVAGNTFPINPLANASSTLAVIYSSTTSGVCAIVGSTVTIVAPGICTIAANQSGSANYLAAPQVTRSVALNTTAPGAPTIGAASGGNAQATINFTPPSNNGGSAIIDYTATCNPGALSAVGAASPIIVSGLANGVSHTCSVTARNAVGSSAASATVSVTPLSGQGSTLWTQVCDVCHTSVPSGNQLNGAGTSATVISYVRAHQTLMMNSTAVQALSNADLVDIANYIASVVPENNTTTSVNTPVMVDVGNHITLTNRITPPDNDWSAFTSVEVVTGAANGTLGTFSGTQIQYTPANGFIGVDSFTYRGKRIGTGTYVGDPQTVSITVAPPVPAITSATTANGVFGIAFSYQITATNSPTSFASNGLPGGLSMDAAGLISGIPTVPGQFSVSISATNSGGTGSETLTLQIDPAPQTITFGAQTSPRTYSVGGSFAISPPATGGASMNPIVYGSNTQSVCTVNVSTVTMVSAGICTITADQAGDTNYAAATQVTRNVTINPALPTAPTIGTATAGNTVATINFTPPVNNTGSPITSYNATCTPSGSGSNSVSPINLTGLTNNVTYTCSVTATNGAGTSPASGNVMVTPVSVVPPGAPTIGAATPGDTQATIAFTPPVSDGGGAISNYTATCNPGNLTGSNSASPIVVPSLVNGTAYSCSVTATNAAGTGDASATVNVTPLPVLALAAVVSRKTHGAAGDFGFGINAATLIGGLVDVEPRTIGSGHTIVFSFNNAITAAGSVAVVDALGAAVGAATSTSAGNDVVVTLTGIADNKRVTVTLTNVNGVVTPFSASLGFLVGDVNNTRSVNSSDISSVKARSGQATTALNFKFDVNATGAINSSDISAVKARSGLTLPP